MILQEMLAHLSEHSLYVIIAFVVLRAVALMIPSIPGIFFDILGVIVFGFYGFILAMTGIMIGAMGAFSIARFGGERAVSLFANINRAREWEDIYTKREKFFALFAWRLTRSPYYDSVSYAVGMTKISATYFFFMSLFGIFPIIFALYFFSSAVVGYYGTTIFLVATGVILCFWALLTRSPLRGYWHKFVRENYARRVRILDLMEEYLDVVDSVNKPTGKILTRREIHQKGYWHRTANVHLFSSEGGQLKLLVHRRSNKTEWNQGKWDPSLGGHIIAGENYIQGIVREVQDEIGILLDPEVLIEGPSYKRVARRHNKFSQKFYAQLEHDIESLEFADGEVDDVKLMDADEIERELMEHPDRWTTKLEDYRFMINDLRQRLGLTLRQARQQDKIHQG